MSGGWPLVIAFAVGIATGLVGRRLMGRDGAERMNDLPLPAPLDPAEYQRRRDYNDRRYLESMAQYDKLVPWASGGALVLSMTFLQSFAPYATPITKWCLAAAWLALTLALLSSLYSQYASSRISSWRNSFLEILQNPPSASADDQTKREWENRARGFEQRYRSSARWTKRLNLLGGALLIAGLILLGIFGFTSAPFGKHVSG